MNVGVYGSSNPELPPIVHAASHYIGTRLAQDGHTIITGACAGVPNIVVHAAKKAGGKCVGYSPFTNEQEHVHAFDAPVDPYERMEYLSEDFPYRGNLNACIQYRCFSTPQIVDMAFIIGGRTGTMMEFLYLFELGVPVGVLEGSGGVTNRSIRTLCEDIDKKSKGGIVFSQDPEDLCNQLYQLYEQTTRQREKSI